MRRSLFFAACLTVCVIAAVGVGLTVNDNDNADATTPTVTATKTTDFAGGINTNNGSVTNLTAPADPKLTMRAVTTASGASYARGIVPLSMVEGDEFVLDISVLFRETSRYTSVARFDSYAEYASNSNIFGIERWSNNTLHVVATRYDASSPLLDLVVPNLTVAANTRYDLRLEAKLSSTADTGYTRFYVNGTKVLDSTAPNNQLNRGFSKLRAGVVAVGTAAASVDFGSLSLAPPSAPPPTC